MRSRGTWGDALRAESQTYDWRSDVTWLEVIGGAGASGEAARQLESVIAWVRTHDQPDAHLLEESIGVLARTEKDFGCPSDDAEIRKLHFERSLALYDEAYRSTGRYWIGINVATLCNLVGRPEDAIEVVNETSRRPVRLLLPSA